MESAAHADEGTISLVVEHARLTQEQVLIGELSVTQDLVDRGQGVDDVGIFEIRLAIVVGLDDAELCHGLPVDVSREVSESSSRPEELGLVAPGGLADDA